MRKKEDCDVGLMLGDDVGDRETGDDVGDTDGKDVSWRAWSLTVLVISGRDIGADAGDKRGAAVGESAGKAVGDSVRDGAAGHDREDDVVLLRPGNSSPLRSDNNGMVDRGELSTDCHEDGGNVGASAGDAGANCCA